MKPPVDSLGAPERPLNTGTERREEDKEVAVLRLIRERKRTAAALF